MVEADDHAAQNFEAGVLDFADAIDDRRAFANVLILLRLVQRFFVRALDTDEDHRDVRCVHQLQHLIVFGEVERGITDKREGVPLGGLPRGNVA